MKKMFLILFFAGLSNLFPQELNYTITGNLGLDSRHMLAGQIQAQEENNLSAYEEQKKSPFLAGLFSAALPGAGEFYAENYWKSALFLAVEIAVVTTGIIFDKKGDDQTNIFQNYANDNWSAVRYAEWTVQHASEINSGVDPADYNVFDQQGNLNWNELNRLERALGSWYSHQLAPFGDQQYYEMIGKYDQFNVGWNDFNGGNFHYGDPVTSNFHFYAGLRGKANDYYSIASTAVIVIIVNHLASTVDAIITANGYNSDLKVRLNIESQNLGYRIEHYPQLSIQYRF